MEIIGLPFIAYRPFYQIESLDDIASTPSGSRVYFAFDTTKQQLAAHCAESQITFGIEAVRFEEVLYAAAWRASYVLVDAALATQAQHFVQHYLLDTKVALLLTDATMLTEAATAGIDAVVLPNALIRR